MAATFRQNRTSGLFNGLKHRLLYLYGTIFLPGPPCLNIQYSCRNSGTRHYSRIRRRKGDIRLKKARTDRTGRARLNGQIWPLITFDRFFPGNPIGRSGIESANNIRSTVTKSAVGRRQVFMNICTNAAQSMEKNGGILENPSWGRIWLQWSERCLITKNRTPSILSEIFHKHVSKTKIFYLIWSFLENYIKISTQFVLIWNRL